MKKIATNIFLVISAMIMFWIVATAAVPACNIVKMSNFNDDYLFGGGANLSLESTGDAIYGKSLKFSPTDTLSFRSMAVGMIESEMRNYTVSFDFKANTDDHFYKMLFRDTNGDDFSCITWTHGGKVLIPTNGVHPHTITASSDPDGSDGFKTLGAYDTDWHNITAKFKFAHKNTTIDWYYDGEYVMTANVTKRSKANAVLKTVFMGSTKATDTSLGVSSGEALIYDGTEAMYLDNFSITFDDDYYYYATTQLVDDTIFYSFTEPTDELLSKENIMLVNGETGECVSLLSSECNRRSGSITFADALEGGVEYFIRFGNISQSISGKKYSDDASVSVDSSENKIVSFRSVNTDGKEATPYTSDTLSTVEYLNLYLNCDVAADTLTNENIMVTNDNGIADYSIAEYNPSDRVLTIELNSFLEKGTTYTVTAKNLVTSANQEIKDYETSFTVSNEEVVKIKKLALVDSNGKEVAKITDLGVGNIFVDAVFLNSTDYDKVFRLSLFAEKDGVTLPEQLKEKRIIVSANTKYTENELSVNLESTDNIKLYLLVTDDDYVPFIKSVVLDGQTGVSDDYWRSDFSAENVDFANQVVFVDVVNYNKTHDDAKEGVSDVVVYRTVVEANEDGKYSFTMRFPNTSKSNVYKVYAYSESGKNQVSEIEFVNINEVGDAVDDIAYAVANLDKKDAIDAIAKILTENYYSLQLSNIENYSSIDKNGIAGLVYNYTKNDGVMESTQIETSIAAICKSAVVEAIKEGLVTDLFDYAELLELDESKIKDFYKQPYNSLSIRKAVTLALKNIDPLNVPDDIFEQLYEKFVIEVLADPDGINNVKAILNEFAQDIGISKNADSAVYRKLAQNRYKSFEDIKRAFDLANDEQDKENNNGSNRGPTRNNTSISVHKSDTSLPVAEPINKNIFNDLDNHVWAQEAITYLAEKKIINGKENYMFYPSDYITRNEMVKILVLAFADKVRASQNVFTDVNINDWSYDYVLKAISTGIVKGYDDNTFRGNEIINRQDAAVTIYRAAVYDETYFDDEFKYSFLDEELFSDYAALAINKLYNRGYISGVGDGKFAPKQYITRAEVAKIVYSIITD